MNRHSPMVSDTHIAQLQGPILVLGASGFIGANLFRRLLDVRQDVWGTASRLPAWRLSGLPNENIVACDLLVEVNLRETLGRVQPATIFDTLAYGAYSFETDTALVYRTNVDLLVSVLGQLDGLEVKSYIHAGSSSEYGASADAPVETVAPTPNSHYAVSKAAAASVIYFAGKHQSIPCANLRFYSVYGPYEDPARLIPTLIARGAAGKLPDFVDPTISRDFVYIDDAVRAFVFAALNLRPGHYGESFNIGSGQCTTIAEVAAWAQKKFAIADQPQFTMKARDWDTRNWHADSSKAAELLDWRAATPFEEGLQRTLEWYSTLVDAPAYLRSSKKDGVDTRHSLSAIIACYKDAQAIPIMYERLTRVFSQLGIDYEIIFVNDCSPDDTEEVIRALSLKDRHVLGISHSRNFGSQPAFRSGMELASKGGCVLMDGDLQDPPELIADFVEQWKAGYDVVYGRRVKRDAPWHMRLAYKTFYRLFDKFSYLQIPHDAGDFSLLDRRVVDCLLEFPERDMFLRGIRAFAGFRQTGIDHTRPERMFGRSTNNLLKNIAWAKKGMLSFSNTPLSMMTALAISLAATFFLLGAIQVVTKLWMPELAPRGITTMMLLVTFFGSVNLLALSLLGEYIAKIFEEVKRRPHFIRRRIIKQGELREAGQSHRRRSRR